MDIIDSCLTCIHEESASILSDHLEVLGQDEVKVVVLVEQRRYLGALEEIGYCHVEVFSLWDGAWRSLNSDLVGLDDFKLENPFSAAVGSAILDGN